MKKYWKEIKSKKSDQEEKPVVKEIDGDNSLYNLFRGLKKDGPASRRDFLKLCGYSFAITALASCETKVRKAIPYVIAPIEITPGEANYYASSYLNGSDYCSIIVKTREGRPIKIEGNSESGITMGGTSARVQASVLDLYDTNRFHGPIKNGNVSDWESVDKEITGKLKEMAEAKKSIVLLTPTIFSPSSEAVIAGFLEKFPGTEWIQYDAVSYSGMLEANKLSFDKMVIPDYRFDKSDLIVSIGADFLGTWLSPVEYTKQFASKRNPENGMNYLIQIESNLSLTGSNADKRILIKPSYETDILLNIYKDILKSVENREIDTPPSPVDVSDISGRLLAAQGKSLVISATNDIQIQQLVNVINKTLGNIGQTILFDSYLRVRKGLDSNMEKLVKKMINSDVDALIVWNVNPAYTWYDREGFIDGLKKIDLSVSLSSVPDETSILMQYICPDHHYLESWNDVEARRFKYSLMQPVINPIYNTRQMQDSLIKWSDGGVVFSDFLKGFWATNFMPMQTDYFTSDAFFENTLQKGIFEPVILKNEVEIVKEIEDSIQFDIGSINHQRFQDKVEVVLYECIALGEGRQGNNPWLQELPDPVTKICWDNYASVSPAQANELGLLEGEIVSLGNIELPVHIQPGQAIGTIGVALGYGRTVCGLVGDKIGVDVWKMSSMRNGNIAYSLSFDSIVKTGKQHSFAQTQTHHSMEGRALVREAGLIEFEKDQHAGNELHVEFTATAKSQYKPREYPHLHWGMAIDLSKCTGCANCVIACQAENNIPVVGKAQVEKGHEMHWIRIDRYYSGSEDDPEVLFQPVLCQHCNNAPCENVCPVAATNQSSEGLNQMIYNRCIGTRYCNNNCPYKVRRFNWFNYTEAGTISGNLRDSAGMTSDLRRLVLNPDVTVRSQGVIEKCSFCIQRIQAVKLKAKGEGRAIRDAEVQTACSQTCPANAIFFGDMNDTKSEISKLIKSGRRYNLLEELYTKPAVSYLTKIRNNKS
jgi:molybdopterin-containing oxidoreductase family iron-sulfur binding subunit